MNYFSETAFRMKRWADKANSLDTSTSTSTQLLKILPTRNVRHFYWSAPVTLFLHLAVLIKQKDGAVILSRFEPLRQLNFVEGSLK